MPTAKQKAATDNRDSGLAPWPGDDRELDALAHRLAKGGTRGAKILFQQLGTPEARRVGKALRQRADADPASRPIYERALTELICADLADQGLTTSAPRANAAHDEAQGSAPAQATSVD
jgi:hypothetical protein